MSNEPRKICQKRSEEIINMYCWGKAQKWVSSSQILAGPFMAAADTVKRAFPLHYKYVKQI